MDIIKIDKAIAGLPEGSQQYDQMFLVKSCPKNGWVTLG